MFKPEPQELAALLATLKQAASSNPNEAAAAQREVAKAIENPIRKVLLSGDIVSGIYTPMDFTSNPRVEFLLDLLTPGQERQHYAYVIPNHGQIPMKRVEYDYLMVPTYRIGNSIDCVIRIIEDANMPIISRMIEIMEAGVVKKLNDDGWQTILSAAVDRNVLINDPNASAGQFTHRLVTLMKTFMRRNGGGNSGTMNRSKLTDLYLSPEAVDDIRTWNLEQVPDQVRTNIYYSDDAGNELVNIFNVNLHALDEFGEAQEYQNYFSGTLGGSMAASDVEIVVGLDRSKQDFVMPYRKRLEVFEDNTLHRQELFGLYCWQEQGFACLDSRRVILGSI